MESIAAEGIYGGGLLLAGGVGKKVTGASSQCVCACQDLQSPILGLNLGGWKAGCAKWAFRWGCEESCWLACQRWQFIHRGCGVSRSQSGLESRDCIEPRGQGRTSRGTKRWLMMPAKYKSRDIYNRFNDSIPIQFPGYHLSRVSGNAHPTNVPLIVQFPLVAR